MSGRIEPLFREGQIVVVVNVESGNSYMNSYGEIKRIEDSGDGNENYFVAVNGSILKCTREDLRRGIEPPMLPRIR